MPVRDFVDGKGRTRYCVEFEARGHRVFRRLPPGAKKGQATALEARLRHQLIDQAVVGVRPDPPLVKAIDEWLEEEVKGRKSEAETRSKAGVVKAAVDGLRVSEILGAVKLVGARVRGEGRPAPATVNRRRCILKAVARFAFDKGWLAENVSRKIKLLPGEVARQRVVTAREIERLIRHAEGFEAKAFIAFGAYACLRQGEVMALQPPDVRGAITVREAKTGSPRVVPIVPQLRPYLKAVPFRAHVRTLYAAFEAARDAAGLDGLVYHDLRRSGATILINSGEVTLEVVRKILGHKSVVTTLKVYALVLDRTAARAMRRGFKPINIPSGRRARKTKEAVNA